MTLRICTVHGCPNPTDRGRCTEHRAEQRKAKGDRPHLHEHRRTREERIRSALDELCAYCHEPLLQGQDLELDHSTPYALDPTSEGDRIVHARCNSSAGGQLSHTLHPNTDR